MKLRDFPNLKFTAETRIELLQLGGLKDPIESIENYLDSVSLWIYSEIEHDYSNDDERHFYSWALHVISTNLMRSLYLRNGFVEMVNSNNYVSVVLQLKAWFEIAACLASVRSIMKSEQTLDQKQNRLSRYVLGNRGDGIFRVGNINSHSVQTMIQKADKLFQEIVKDNGKELYISKLGGRFFTDFYDNASNGSHPNHDSSALVSDIKDKKTVIKTWNQAVKLFSDRRGDYGGLLMAPMFVAIICKDLFEDFKEQFAKVDSKPFFSDF